MVFNWHDTDDEGDHNAVETLIFILTEGGNSSLADNSTEQYMIEALAVRLNHTHFAQNASSTPWPCTRDSSAGNSSELSANAARLGARAILTYTEGVTYAYYNLTDNDPLTTTPIYTTENWNGALVFSDEVEGLFAPSPLKLYDAQAVARLTPNITVDFAALRTNGSFLTQSGAVLTRIPAIAHNVSAAVAAATKMSVARIHSDNGTRGLSAKDM
ncbi:hypothetical protein DFH08DRAFT_883120, partial [Mycena albidolilacea]